MKMSEMVALKKKNVSKHKQIARPSGPGNKTMAGNMKASATQANHAKGDTARSVIYS